MYVMYAHMYVFMYLPLAHNGYNCAVNKILFYSILFYSSSQMVTFNGCPFCGYGDTGIACKAYLQNK